MSTAREPKFRRPVKKLRENIDCLHTFKVQSTSPNDKPNESELPALEDKPTATAADSLGDSLSRLSTSAQRTFETPTSALAAPKEAYSYSPPPTGTLSDFPDHYAYNNHVGQDTQSPGSGYRSVQLRYVTEHNMMGETSFPDYPATYTFAGYTSHNARGANPPPAAIHYGTGTTQTHSMQSNQDQHNNAQAIPFAHPVSANTQQQNYWHGSPQTGQPVHAKDQPYPSNARGRN